MKRQQKHKHAYDPAEIDSLKGIPIPEKIKCGRCAKNLPHLKYSTKQLTDFRYQVKTEGRVTKPICCHSCSGGSQVVEIECNMCHKTKGLEDFAKSQRAKPDTAKCFKCVEEQLKQKPIDHDAYAQGKKTFITPDHVNGHTPDYWSSADSTANHTAAAAAWAEFTDDTQTETDALSGRFRRSMSVKSADTDDLIGSEFSTPGRSKTDKEGAWKDVGEASWRTRSTGPTTISDSGSQHSFASSVAERSSVKPGGWAKIKAYEPSSPDGGVMLPHGDAQREVDAAWDASSDEETSSDEDDSDGEKTVI